MPPAEDDGVDILTKSFQRVLTHSSQRFKRRIILSPYLV
jgi:hypothetical protein